MSKPTEDQWAHWEKHGYIVFEDAIHGDELERLQSAFTKAAADAKPGWIEAVEKEERSAAYFDIPNPLPLDPVFMDIVDHPTFFPVILKAAEGDLLFLGPQVRTLPPSPQSYSWWHPDNPRDQPFMTKVQIYVDDVAEDEGPFAYVPGSHKPEKGNCPRVRYLESMPGHKILAGKAGTAIAFNGYGWHTAMRNLTNTPRRSIILCYGSWSEDRSNPDRWSSIADLADTPKRKRLFELVPR